jgi:hypothetical protein
MREATERDLLTALEIECIPEPYREYYRNKRHNLFATIQHCPYIWNAFMHLDAILMREFDDLQRVTEPGVAFPLILFMNAHQKLRVAFELGCQTCMPEAHSMMRDAVESAAHARRLALNPHLLKLWMEKNDSDSAAQAFRQEFEYSKAKLLFDGLPELHKMWKQYSEFGSHTNINSIVSRFRINDTTTDRECRLHYTGAEAQVFVPALFELLLVCYLI